MIFLENEYIKASIANKGAELQSLKSKETGKEYMWSGNPGYWAKFSPVLFPIVGGLKNNTYLLDGKEYHLPRHGFARDHEFETKQINSTEALFTLTQNQETLKAYPFQFTLGLHYKLTGTAISCTYQVTNPGNTTLPFSIGGHPAFAAMVNNDLKYTDYFLEFNNDDELVYHKIKSDLISDETCTIQLTDHILPLKHELFYDDALVFKTLKSDRISLRNTKGPHGLHFHFHDFPFFGIWAAKDADFVCLEPWCGIADGINHDQDFKKKEGVIQLAPNTNWERQWSAACF